MVSGGIISAQIAEVDRTAFVQKFQIQLARLGCLEILACLCLSVGFS
jgi:hypothetical protein